VVHIGKKDVLKNVEPSVIKDLKLLSGNDKTDLANVVDTLLNDKWNRRKTRLRSRLICKLSTLDTLAQLWEIEFLKTFIEGYTEYMTSLDGKGRQEIVDITKYTIDKETSARKEMMEVLGRR